MHCTNNIETIIIAISMFPSISSRDRYCLDNAKSDTIKRAMKCQVSLLAVLLLFAPLDIPGILPLDRACIAFIQSHRGEGATCAHNK